MSATRRPLRSWFLSATLVAASAALVGRARAEDPHGLAFDATDVAWTDALAHAKEAGKAVFVDFSTEH